MWCNSRIRGNRDYLHYVLSTFPALSNNCNNDDDRWVPKLVPFHILRRESYLWLFYSKSYTSWCTTCLSCLNPWSVSRRIDETTTTYQFSSCMFQDWSDKSPSILRERIKERIISLIIPIIPLISHIIRLLQSWIYLCIVHILIYVYCNTLASISSVYKFSLCFNKEISLLQTFIDNTFFQIIANRGARVIAQSVLDRGV